MTFQIKYKPAHPLMPHTPMSLMHNGNCVGYAEKMLSTDKWKAWIFTECGDDLLLGIFDTREDVAVALWDNRYNAYTGGCK